MTGHFFLAPLLLGASCLYLLVVVWSYRASRRRVFSLPWLLLPLGSALLAGITLALSIPTSPASSVSLRLLELLAHLCNILLIWMIAGKITPSYRLAGTWLYAWNPLVIIELAVYANTAGVVICLLLLAVALLLRNTFLLNQIAALALVGLAMRINVMTLLLAPLLLWFIVRHRRGVSAALAGFAWRALVVLAVFVLAYLPDWRGSETFLAITNGLSFLDFANSPLSLVVAPARALFTFVAQQAHFPPLMQPDIAADMTVLATSFFLFALLYLREMGRVREVLRPDAEAEPVLSGDARIDEDRHKAPTPPLPGPLSLQDVGGDGGVGSLPYDTLFTNWAVVLLGYIVLAATVFMPGYLVWGVWVVALRRFDTLTVAIVLLSCSALVYYLFQWLALPATSLLLPLCVFGIPLVYLVVQYCVPVRSGIERKHVLK